MKVIKGDLFKAKHDMILITTNSVVKKNGCLVMGAGIAKYVRDRWSGIDYKLGQAILMQSDPDCYGVILGVKLGIFQTKVDYAEDSPEWLLKYSTEMLQEIALNNPDKTYGLNFPAIGCGGLAKEVVFDIIKVLPDNIFVYYK